MRISQSLTAVGIFALAGLLALAGAAWAVTAIEKRSVAAIGDLLREEGFSWVAVSADGLQVQMSGTAPTEATRFRALTLAGSVVDASRIIDAMEAAPATVIEAPRFSVELLRNDDGISLIGLLPAGTESGELVKDIQALARDAIVTDMLESADYQAPEGWDAALKYGLAALKVLPRSKISISADRVAITAISDSEAEKRKLESDLARKKPDGLLARIDISAPRPVITPFTLRFVMDEAGPRFDACSADTERARGQILAAAVAAGAKGKIACTIGLGVPSPSWGNAASFAIAALADLGQGTITFSDADISLVATEDTLQADFDRVVGDLEGGLPDVFSLTATLPEKPKAVVQGPSEFTASLAAEGAVQLRGRITDDTLRAAVNSYARAHFGAGQVQNATRLDPELPDGWSLRVLAGLESLSELVEGHLLVRADTVEVSGISGSQDAQANIARILSDKLGEGKVFKVSVTYDERLDQQAALPSPEECVTMLNGAVASKKIAFAPGSAEIESGARETLDTLAEIVRQCADVRMEIGGHTDSQGSESGNLALSQARAEAVLIAIQGRRVLVGNVSAKGFGESSPIDDNGTEAGREANRRIEFRLIAPENEAEAQDAIETSQDQSDAPAENDAAAPDENAEVLIDGAGDGVDEGSGDGDMSAKAGYSDQGADAGAGDGADQSAEATTTAGTEAEEQAPADPVADLAAGSAEAGVNEGGASKSGVNEGGAAEAYASSAPTEKTSRPKPRPQSR